MHKCLVSFGHSKLIFISYCRDETVYSVKAQFSKINVYGIVTQCSACTRVRCLIFSWAFIASYYYTVDIICLLSILFVFCSILMVNKCRNMFIEIVANYFWKCVYSINELHIDSELIMTLFAYTHNVRL